MSCDTCSRLATQDRCCLTCPEAPAKATATRRAMIRAIADPEFPVQLHPFRATSVPVAKDILDDLPEPLRNLARGLVPTETTFVMKLPRLPAMPPEILARLQAHFQGWDRTVFQFRLPRTPRKRRSTTTH